ncbi:bacterial regulatory helix-turn-helix, lysR family protein, partial [Vibrio parahaemolyticus VP2007-007]
SGGFGEKCACRYRLCYRTKRESTAAFYAPHANSLVCVWR